jgi:hypothetical protein
MPLSDFSSHDPDFTQEQEKQCARIIEGLRQVNAKVVRLGGSLDALTSAANQVDALLGSLDEVTRTRAMESYRYQFDLEHPNDVIPFNPATGEYNPLAPKLKMALDGKKLVAHCEFSNCYESAPDSVQGGMVAAVFDQLLAYSIMVEGFTGPTIWIRVNYLKPTPLNETLRFESSVDSVDGKKFKVKGSCYRGDKKISEAEGLILGSYELTLAGGKGRKSGDGE